MSRSPEIPRASSLPDVIKEMRKPHTETDTGFIVVGTWIAEGDPGNDPGTDELSPPFLNGWENIPGFRSGFRVNEIGDIEIVAAVRNGTLGQPAFILPEDFRRDYDSYVLQATDQVGIISKIKVTSDGEVIILEIFNANTETIEIPEPDGVGIEFDTSPQSGGWLYVESTSAGPGPPTPGQAGIQLHASGGNPIVFRSTGGGGIQLVADFGGSPVYGGDGIFIYSGDAGVGITCDGTGDISLQTARDILLDTGDDIELDAQGSILLDANAGINILSSSFAYIESGGTSDITLQSAADIRLNATGIGREIVLEAGSEVLVDVGNAFIIDVGAADQVFTVFDDYAALDLNGASAFDFFAGDVGIGADSTLGVYMGLPVGASYTVYDSTNTPIFRVDENGDLHGKTGKALVFDL